MTLILLIRPNISVPEEMILSNLHAMTTTINTHYSCKEKETRKTQ